MPYTPDTPNGNILYTPSQETYLAAAYTNPSSTFPGNDANFFNDTASLNSDATDFANDMSGQGFDRGRFDFAWSNNSRIIEFPEDGVSQATAQLYEPFFNQFPCGSSENCNRNIHAAAIKAFALKDSTLALQVFNALLARAQDDRLDPSNGGFYRNTGGGEPDRPNPTFGQTQRYERNFGGIYGGGPYTTNGNPWFIKASKMEQYLLSYGIIYDLVSGTPEYTANGTFINYWFKDWHDFFLARFTIKQNDWFGANWRTFSGYPEASRSSTGNVVLRNSDCSVIATVTNSALQGLNNRALDIASFLKAYATMYGLETTEEYIFDYFRLVIALGVLPDGLYTEFYRDGFGPDYAFTAVTHLVLMAHLNEVAVIKGFLPSEDSGKYFDYTSSLGTSEIYTNFSASNTSGGNKGIRLIIEKLAQIYRSPAVNNGLRGLLSTGGGSCAPLSSSLRPSLPIAIANGYYQDPDIEDFWRFSTSAGYEGTNPTGSANGASPHTLGISWDMGAAIGGLGPFSLSDVYSGTPPPTTEPVESNNAVLYITNP